MDGASRSGHREDFPGFSGELLRQRYFEIGRQSLHAACDPNFRPAGECLAIERESQVIFAGVIGHGVTPAAASSPESCANSAWPSSAFDWSHRMGVLSTPSRPGTCSLRESGTGTPQAPLKSPASPGWK